MKRIIEWCVVNWLFTLNLQGVRFVANYILYPKGAAEIFKEEFDYLGGRGADDPKCSRVRVCNVFLLRLVVAHSVFSFSTNGRWGSDSGREISR